MIKIEFVSEISEDEAVWAQGFYIEKNEGHLPPAISNAITKKPYENVLEVFIKEDSKIKRSIFVKLGSSNDSTRITREVAGASLYKKVLEGNERVLVLDIREMEVDGLDLLTGFLLSSWRFDKYRTIFKPHENNEIDKILVLCRHPQEVQKNFKRHQAVIEGVFFARALTSEPPNVLYPMAYAERLKELESYGVKVEILDEKNLETLGMNAILAVGKGSGHDTSVVVMSWNGLQQEKQPIVLVGKGVCFDSGGLCLKPAIAQQDMKWDKAGASVVAGLMKTLALQKAPVHVIGIVGLVENMPDGCATKPGDVISTMSGQTVEIVDTDSEGRLALADCLWYAQQRFQPQVMIDLGTLTIETIACLGNIYGGLYSNFSELTNQLKKAGDAAGELLWELPMGPPFAKQIESSIADIKNAGITLGGENAAAAEFLRRFVGDIPWAHIDIAGVSWIKEDHPLMYKGVTGFGVRLLEEWINREYIRPLLEKTQRT